MSWCYTQAWSARASTADMWTVEARRRPGLATLVARAVIEQGLERAIRPSWLCDEANIPSCKLAEGLGFRFQGNLDLVDAPLDPYSFYGALGLHFFLPHQRTVEAAMCFARGFRSQQGSAEVGVQTALVRAQAGDGARALDYLRQAADLGWEDANAATEADAFECLGEIEAWRDVLRRLLENERNGG